MPKNRLYLAYGSNINIGQMAFRCPTARQAGTAMLKDHELLFRGGRRGGVATVEPRTGSSVPVLLWNIKPKDEIALDRFEGFPHRYTKRMMDVELDGRPVSVMAYVMTPGHDAGFPSQCYLDLIAEGYQRAGFDLAILDAAVDRTEEVMQKEMEQLAAELEKNQDYGQLGLFDMKGWW